MDSMESITRRVAAAKRGLLGAYVAAQWPNRKKGHQNHGEEIQQHAGRSDGQKSVPVILEFQSLDVIMGFNLRTSTCEPISCLEGRVLRLNFAKTGTFVFMRHILRHRPRGNERKAHRR